MVAFGTWQVLQSNLLVAIVLLSPFWFLGIVMWKGLLIRITETQVIVMGPDKLSITKNSVVSSEHLTIPYSEMRSINIESIVMSENPMVIARYRNHRKEMFGGSISVPLPTISHGTKKTYFAENASRVDMEWLVKALKAFVFKKVSIRV